MFNKIALKIVPYVVILALCLVAWNAGQRAVEYHQKADTLEATISDLDQEIKRTKTSLNDSISLYQAEVKSLNMTKDNIEAKYGKLLKAMSVKPKDVESVTEVSSVTSSVDTVVAGVDPFGGIRAELRDPFVSIDVEVLPDMNTIIDYEVRDSLMIFDIQKKHSWLFGLIKWNEHKGMRVINHNPKANVTSLQTIDVIE